MLKVLLFTCFVCLSSFVEANKDFTYSSSFEKKIKKFPANDGENFQYDYGKKSYTNDGKNFQYDYGNGQKFWGSPKRRFCTYDGRTYNDRDHDNFDAIVNKLNDGNPYLSSKDLTPVTFSPSLHLKEFFSEPSEKELTKKPEMWTDKRDKNEVKDFFSKPSEKESPKEIEISIYKRDKNGIVGFSCRYPNGDAYDIKGDARFCTLKGQKYDSRYDNNFDDIVKQLNNGNPTPHFLEPYKHFFKEAVKPDGLNVADGYKKSLENISNRKLRKKIENLVKGWLKKITSKKYKQRGLVSDDVYRAAYQVLGNGQLTVKNVAKRVKEKIEYRAER